MFTFTTHEFIVNMCKWSINYNEQNFSEYKNCIEGYKKACYMRYLLQFMSLKQMLQAIFIEKASVINFTNICLAFLQQKVEVFKET